MKIGKLDNAQLEEIVLKRLPALGSDIQSGPAVGIDCSVIETGYGQIALSTDPITGAAANIGQLAVHIACNDIAACGIRPTALLMTIIAPPDATEAELIDLVEQVSKAAASVNVSIIGGHTEISDAVNRFLISSTVLGLAKDQRVVLASGGQPGDAVVMTKTAGLEGTAILAVDAKEKLQGHLTREELLQAGQLIDQISVIEDGTVGQSAGVHAMHDATEGGILGAAWELAQASGLGCQIELNRIPIAPLTQSICDALGLEAGRLIASGSMIMATSDPDRLISELEKAGIRGTVIGRLTKNSQRELVLDDKTMELLPPAPDELYKIQ